ncbi:MAG: 4Fe-4S dicluster domain-containing protein [Candidatus Methanoliparum thermophilum]|uniref:4Fe-4S dicluster domain-containing protein n=1 Tax=Methanoliparum thermophilum TaxID=2491083 RepID=A0A520KRT7_METT2|nr:MAG: 4Fe-4S dicluster domain-containing protein [Candidatus Methanoliparum thermophilum]
MKMKIQIPANLVRKPIVSDIVLKTKVLINLEKVNIETNKADMIVDVKDEWEDVKKAFEERGIKVDLLKEPIKRRLDRCVMCGICSMICPVDVFKISEDWEVKMDSSRCIICKNCIDLCPTESLTIDY